MPQRRYTEEQARTILERAISAGDLESSLWSADDLLYIARELDIPEQSLRDAMRRFDLETNSRKTADWATSVAKLAVIGGAVAGAGLLLDSSTAPTVLLSVVSIGLALDARRRAAYLNFVIRNAALWAAFYGVVELKYWVEPGSAATVTGICLGAGCLAMAIIRSLPPDNPIPGFSRRIVRALRTRLHIWKDRIDDDPSMFAHAPTA